MLRRLGRRLRSGISPWLLRDGDNVMPWGILGAEFMGQLQKYRWFEERAWAKKANAVARLRSMGSPNRWDLN